MNKKKCKHGLILYGTRCINCEREKKSKSDREKAKQAVADRAKKLLWVENLVHSLWH